MSEQAVPYLLNTCDKPVTMDTQLHTLRADLEEIERRLIPLLVTVQRALGKEPTIPGRGEKGLTRAERRRR